MNLFFHTFILFLDLLEVVFGVAPAIDLSHNMRILKLPQDTKVGSVIYRLRGSDPDNDRLTFGVRGDVGQRLLEIQSTSEIRANVILKSTPTEKEYQLTIYVTDGSQTTEVESTIIITNSSGQPSPFLDFKPLITISEMTPENEVIGAVVVKKRNSSSLPVLFEIQGSEKFAIKYVISPLKEASKAELSLVQKVDYEKKNLFQLTIFALNPWIEEDVDTRNVATAELYVAVEDAQDTPPVFTPLPPVIKVSDSLKQGGDVVKITAEDGDFGNPRNISYSFVPGSPGLSFFNIHPRTGVVTLISSIERLRESYSTTGPFILSLQATEIETESNPGAPMTSEASIAFVLVNTENRPPRFLSNRYVGSVVENSPELTAVIWEGAAVPRVLDDDQGRNGSFEIYLDGDGGVFSVQPSRAMNELNFAVLVKNPDGLDYETSDTKYIEFKIVARETASIRPLTATAEIRIKITDANDNIPKFSEEVYNVSLPEDASPGTRLIRIQATDEDMGSYGVVRYTAVNGPIAGNLHLDPVTGELTLISGEGLDRERIPEYTLAVEARDDEGKGNRNTAEVRVTLVDANDNAPVFLQPRYDGVLNPDMESFYERLKVQAYDADGPGPNSNITYEIVNGNYQEKFLIDTFSGEITLKGPLISAKDPQEHGLPVITLTVRAHDQGVPVRYSKVKVQVHNQEYLNRSISFVVPQSKDRALEKKPELERSLSTLTGAHVNIHEVSQHNTSQDKSVVRCWVSYPLSSTVDLSNMDMTINSIFGREYYREVTKASEAVNQSSFDVVFWLLIALVILMILAILALLFYCCCVRVSDRTREKLEINNKIAPEENVITYKENGAAKVNKENRRRSRSLTRETWSGNRRPTRMVQRSMSATEGDVQTDKHQQAEVQETPNEPNTSDTRYAQEEAAAHVYYPNGAPGGRMERAYRQGRPLSPGTEMMLQDMGQDVSARRVGNYMVVRKVIHPRVRVHADDEDKTADHTGEGPKRTEILYIRSPLRDEEDERQYATMERNRQSDGEHLRSVSETAIDGEDSSPATLRVPRTVRPRMADFRGDTVDRMDGQNQQLKFSRYHRTDSDVYLIRDPQAIPGQSEVGRSFQTAEEPPGHWVPVGTHQDYLRDRPGRQPWPERWETEDYYQRQPLHRYNLSDTGEYKDIIDPGVRDERPRPPMERLDQAASYSQAVPTHIPSEHMPQVSHREQQFYQPHPQEKYPQDNELQTSMPNTQHRQELLLPPTQISHTQQDSHNIQSHMQQELQTVPGTRSNVIETQQLLPPQSMQQPLPPQSMQQTLPPQSMQQQGPFMEQYQTQENSLMHSRLVNEVQMHQQQQQEHLSQQEKVFERERVDQHDETQHHVQELEEEESSRQDYELDSQQRKHESTSHKDDTQTNIYDEQEDISTERKEDEDVDQTEKDTEGRNADHIETDESKVIRASTEEETTTQNPATDLDGEDSDSGIGKDGTGLRLKKANLLEKKSLFTIAYDGMQTRGLKSAGDRDDSP